MESKCTHGHMTDQLRNTINWNEKCMRWRGAVLTGEYAHYCWDWDMLPVDETTPEWSTCTCFADALLPVLKR